MSVSYKKKYLYISIMIIHENKRQTIPFKYITFLLFKLLNVITNLKTNCIMQKIFVNFHETKFKIRNNEKMIVKNALF